MKTYDLKETSPGVFEPVNNNQAHTYSKKWCSVCGCSCRKRKNLQNASSPLPPTKNLQNASSPFDDLNQALDYLEDIGEECFDFFGRLLK